MSKPLLILGCGGHGRVVADVARACGYERIAFLDDAHDAAAISFPILGSAAMLESLVSDWPQAIAAIGKNVVRLELFKRLQRAGYKTPSIVHPSAVISRTAYLGAGVFVAPVAIVNTGAEIADATIVNTGARIDHDCRIGAAGHIAPGATLSGSIMVGDRAQLGAGCSIRQGVKIAADIVVGVGAAVVTVLAEAGTYVGVPARLLPKST